MNTPKITLEEIGIIKDAKAGKESAFNLLYRKYRSFVIDLLNQYIKDIDESKDLSNLVFLKVHQKLSKFKDYHSFGGWLRILTKNTAIDYLRTLKNKTISIDDQENGIQLSDIGDIVDENISITYDMLIGMLGKQTETNRKIIKLYYEEGMTVLQISKAINVPVGTIKSYLHRIRNNLKKQLKLC